MAEAGMQEVETYVSHRQNNVTQFIATRPIMDLCLETVWNPGAWVLKRWWEKEGIGMEGIWEAAQVAEVYRDLVDQAGEDA